MPGFAPTMSMEDSHDPVCRVVVLEDQNGDGVMDKRTVFADGLVLPRTIKTIDGAVLVGEPPNLWLMKDTNGDLKADSKVLISDSFGRRGGNIEHNANSLIWGIDNWLYTSEHDWHLRYHDGKFEVMPTLNRGQWGGAIDDDGRVYRDVNNQPIFVDITPARYFMRNPDVTRTRGLYESMMSLEDAVAWPARATLGVNRGYRDQNFRPDGSSKILQGAGAPIVYRGDRLPKELQGNVFITDSPTNLVHRFVIDDNGGQLTARNGYKKGEMVASTDERFRPVQLASAPDGTLYIVDMYRGVVQDVTYQTDYLKTYIKNHQLELPVSRGRIWRLVHDGTRLDVTPHLSEETPAGLVRYLSHPNGWWRDTAQQLLVQRGDKSVVPALRALVRDAPDWRTKLHAMGTLDGLDSLDQATVQVAIADQNPEVRAWGIRWSEHWLGEPGNPFAAELLRLIDDPNWTVRRQVAASIGALPKDARVEPAVTMLEKYAADPITVDATISGLKDLESAVLDRLLQAQVTDTDADAVAMLSGAVAKGGDVTQVEHVIAMTGDTSRPVWQRTALLQGLDTGLPSGGGGGRFGGGGGRGAAPASAQGVTLPSDPLPLATIAAVGSTDMAAMAKSAMAKLDWPGKPVPKVTATPLTPEEQKLFAEGEELYKNICIACHQADGQGKDKVAPSLVISPYVLARDPGLATRIVLAGKEGVVGLMPPLGLSLNDEQVAAALTFVRRSWGHTGSAVDPAEVQEIRGLTKARTTPWTDAELQGMRGFPGRGGAGGRGGAAAGRGAGPGGRGQ